MQFRERRRVIQVIRTTYDPKLKRGRSEMIGKIDKSNPVISDTLSKVCSPEEIKEIVAWLFRRGENLRNAAARGDTMALPEQIRRAAEYFRDHRDEHAEHYAREIRQAWEELKRAMRKAGFARIRKADTAAPLFQHDGHRKSHPGAY